MEEFRDIKGYEGLYQVSNLGRVKSLPRKGRLSEKITIGSNDGGYRKIGLRKDKNRKQFRVHQLVAQAFLDHTIDNYTMVVDHIDNDKTNNKLSNLQVVTQRQNSSKDTKGTSKYVGVSWSKSSKKWCSEIAINGKSKYLGLFTCEEEASKAYQDALLNL